MLKNVTLEIYVDVPEYKKVVGCPMGIIWCTAKSVLSTGKVSYCSQPGETHITMVKND